MAMSQQQKAESAASAELQMNESCGLQTSYASPSYAGHSCKTTAEEKVLKEKEDLSSSGNHSGPQADQTTPSVPVESSLIPAVSTSGSALASVAQGYSGYAAYSNSDPYGYSSADYAAYYGQYQQQVHYQQHPAQYHQPPSSYPQQADQSYSQQLGGYPNTGAPYQPVSSFQNTGSYGEPATYPSTYYNPGDYQTPGGYTSATYSSQTNFWHGGQYTNHNAHQYSNYTPDPNPAYASTTAVAPLPYQQHYKQWNGYYSQSPAEAICAPGTENISASASSTANSFIAGGNTAFSHSNQNPSVYNPPWRPESSSVASTSAQVDSSTGNVSESYWSYFAPNSQANQLNPAVPLGQKTELTPQYDSSKIPHNVSYGHGSVVLNNTGYQGAQNQHPNSHVVAQPPEPLDPQKACKVQIPTNPRIATNLPVTLPRCEKDSVTLSMMSRPAYVSVKAEKTTEKVASHEEDVSMPKPGAFPRSLRGYVERALSRCKNDRQKLACQAIMKEVITKATAEGTLHTRDWDVEPLFPLPNDDDLNDSNKLFSVPDFLMQKSKSPSRRSKSRWEPIQEEKNVGKPANVSYASRHGFWNSSQFSGGLTENKDSLGTKFSFTDKESFSKNASRPAKRQHVNGDLNVNNDNGSSSDSDKEQNLTKYYAAAIALADTPEEKRRRENRSKRFEKGHSKSNGVASSSGHFHARRASAFEESGSGAVEDIDWDALIIKGTCQEIEKRYLRLTSAPDPATVRPDDVLEKALMMVQNSPKNYLYKCDQLKSIRQDLTVQHIRNEFTVKVYETHARLSIEAGDLPEYNQCQSQLKTLYAEGITGCHMEFAAYNLLSVILHSNNNRDLLSAMSRLSEFAKQDIAVKHALSVRRAVTSGNYVMFFRLYNSAPNLNALFMDLYVEKMRYAAVKCMSRSYRPTVPISYLSQILGFSNALPTDNTCAEKTDGLEECMEWLKAHGACIIRETSGEILFDAKASVSSLYMPDPEDAVSHGDTNLAVNDFFDADRSLKTCMTFHSPGVM